MDQRLWYQQDANFNVTSVSNAATRGSGGVAVERYVYAPYGERTVLHSDLTPAAGGASLFGVDEGHQGLSADAETGLVQNRHRYLHVTLGRFTSSDPLGYVDGLNHYLLALGAPTRWGDPTGTSHRGLDATGHEHAKRVRDRWKSLANVNGSVSVNGEEVWTTAGLGGVISSTILDFYVDSDGDQLDLSGTPAGDKIASVLPKIEFDFLDALAGLSAIGLECGDSRAFGSTYTQSYRFTPSNSDNDFYFGIHKVQITTSVSGNVSSRKQGCCCVYSFTMTVTSEVRDVFDFNPGQFNQPHWQLLGLHDFNENGVKAGQSFQIVSRSSRQEQFSQKVC